MTNFQGKYALPLETAARAAFQLADRKESAKLEVDADDISTGKFVETMQKLLYMKYGISKELSHFCAESDPHWGVTGFEFAEEQAERLFQLFENYYK